MFLNTSVNWLPSIYLKTTMVRQLIFWVEGGSFVINFFLWKYSSGKTFFFPIFAPKRSKYISFSTCQPFGYLKIIPLSKINCFIFQGISPLKFGIPNVIWLIQIKVLAICSLFGKDNSCCLVKLLNLFVIVMAVLRLEFLRYKLLCENCQEFRDHLLHDCVLTLHFLYLGT